VLRPFTCRRTANFDIPRPSAPHQSFVSKQLSARDCNLTWPWFSLSWVLRKKKLKVRHSEAADRHKLQHLSRILTQSVTAIELFYDIYYFCRNSICGRITCTTSVRLTNQLHLAPGVRTGGTAPTLTINLHDTAIHYAHRPIFPCTVFFSLFQPRPSCYAHLYSPRRSFLAHPYPWRETTFNTIPNNSWLRNLG